MTQPPVTAGRISDERLKEMATDPFHAACLLNEVKSIASELSELRATLAKLPRTADGVPIVPGMKVWIYVNDATREEPYERTAESVFTKRIMYPLAERVEGETGARWSCCYSTRDAALSASGKQAEQPKKG